jgi:hypothetical protein
MHALRHLGVLIWLVLAFAAGQQQVVRHDLRHALERVSGHGDPHHAPAQCDEHFACAQLAGAIGSAPVAPAVVPAATIAAPAIVERGIVPAPRYAFRSRAPPVLLA